MVSIKDFYEQRYGSDPVKLIDSYFGSLASIAAESSIDIAAALPDMQFYLNSAEERFSHYAHRKVPVLDKVNRGRVELYSKLKANHKCDIATPFVNFVYRGHPSGSWDGSKYLWEEYNRAKAGKTGTVTLTEQDRKAIEERKAKAAEREEAARKQQAIENARIAKEAADFLLRAPTLPVVTSSHQYLQNKGISAYFPDSAYVPTGSEERKVYDDIRVDEKGTMYIPLKPLDPTSKSVGGWQRIDGTGKKRFTKGVKDSYVGACYVIQNGGDIKNVGLTEGFATGVTCFETGIFDAVIVGISAGNLVTVARHLAAMSPEIRLVVLADNDSDTEARTGVNPGIKEAARILHQHPTYEAIYPVFPEGAPAKASDFNDLEAICGREELIKQLTSARNVVPSPVNEESEGARHAEQSSRENKAYAPVDDVVATLERKAFKVMFGYPVFRTYQEAEAEMMKEALCDKAKQHELVQAALAKAARYYAKNAQKHRSFSDAICTGKDPKVNYKAFTCSKVTDEVVNYVTSLKGITVVRAGMGSGKTKYLVGKLAGVNRRVVLSAHRISIISGLVNGCIRGSDRHDGVYVANYQNIKTFLAAQAQPRVAICVNSLVSNRFRANLLHNDMFVIDEAYQTLRTMLSSGTIKNTGDLYTAVVTTIAASKVGAVLLDADANDQLVDFAKKATAAHNEAFPDDQWPQVNVVELPTDTRYQDDDGNTFQRFATYTNNDRAYFEVQEAVQRGEKVCVASDNAKNIAALAAHIRDNHPDKKVLAITSHTKDEEDVKRFLAYPTTEAVKYDALLYSPSISSGVSIEVKHFTAHFGMFYGNVMPSDAIQMLRRDRNATKWLLGLDNPQVKRETNHDALLASELETLRLSRSETIDDLAYAAAVKEIGLEHNQMRIAIISAENDARNNFANNVVYSLGADGFDTAPLEVDGRKNDEGVDLASVGAALADEEYVAKISALETPDDANALALEMLSERTLEQTLRLNRYKIERYMGKCVTGETAIFIRDRGEEVLRRHELMHIDMATLAKLDEYEQSLRYTIRWDSTQFRTREQTVIIAPTEEQAQRVFKYSFPFHTNVTMVASTNVAVSRRVNAVASAKALREFFSVIGYDIRKGGVVTLPNLDAAIAEYAKAGHMDMLFNALGLQGYTWKKRNGEIKSGRSILKAVLKALGVTPKERQSNKIKNIELEPEELTFFCGIMDYRKENNMTYFAVPDSDTAPTPRFFANQAEVSEAMHNTHDAAERDVAINSRAAAEAGNHELATKLVNEFRAPKKPEPVTEEEAPMTIEVIDGVEPSTKTWIAITPVISEEITQLAEKDVARCEYEAPRVQAILDGTRVKINDEDEEDFRSGASGTYKKKIRVLKGEAAVRAVEKEIAKTYVPPYFTPRTLEQCVDDMCAMDDENKAREALFAKNKNTLADIARILSEAQLDIREIFKRYSPQAINKFVTMEEGEVVAEAKRMLGK